MIIIRMVVGPIETNCYVVIDEAGRDAMVIDPGADEEEIIACIGSHRANLRWIVNTHGHGDHIAANAGLKRAFPAAKLAIHQDDAPMLLDAHLNLSADFGISVLSPAANRLLADGDEIGAGKINFGVIHLPGHTPGGIGLYSAGGSGGENPVLFSGDSLFQGSVGRSDFPGGSNEKLIGAIRARLLTLPGETVVYPGHGEMTTIGEEKKSNPFLA